MNFQQFLRVALARKSLILITLAVTVLTTLVVSLLLPKNYTATTTLVIDFKGSDLLGSAALLPPQVMPGFLATQADIISSRRVALKVIDNLKLADNPEVRRQFMETTEGRGSIRPWLADLLLKKLDLKPSRESSVISLSYTGTDAQFAAALANAFAEAYIQTSLELKVEPARQSAAWFDDQVKVLRTNLEKAQTKLSAAQNEKGIVATDERLDVENARLAELSSQLVIAQSQTYESTSRQRQAATLTGKEIESTPEIVANPYIQSLKAELARQSAKLMELSERVGKNHPQYQSAIAEEQSLRAKVEQELKTVTASIGNSARIAKNRESDLRAALAAQKTKVLQLKKQRDDVTLLTREVESAQRVYDVATQRFDQTRLESHATQTNAAVLTAASPPTEPSSPKIILNTVLAVFLGSLLGLGLALVAETGDRRIRASEDLSEDLGLPVFGVLAAPVKKKRRFFGFGGSRIIPTWRPAQ